MRNDGFCAPGELSPHELPAAYQAAVINAPPTLVKGSEGDDLVVTLQLTAFQRAQAA